MQTHSDTLYEDVAGRVASLIAEGTLRSGERLPSVRRLHRQWSVSISTVLEAYRLLEDRGFIEARSRSGYYVRARLQPVLPEPRSIAPPTRPRRVRTDLVLRMHAEMNTPGTVHLGSGSPDLELLPTAVLARKVAEVLRRVPTAHAYMTGAGAEPLRREIARRMVDAGCSVGPDDVVITSGAQEALFLALCTLTRPGDLVAVESPTYFGLLEILEALHLRVVELRTQPRDGVDLEALSDALRKQPLKAVALVSNYSNPLGSCMDDDKKRALVELLARHGVPLVEDDIYGELPFEGARPRAIKAFDDAGTVVYCSSFSKTISPGFRIGWTVPGQFRADVMWNKNRTSIASASVPQLALAAYLGEGGYERQLRRHRQVLRDNCARITAGVAQHFPPGTRATAPRGGQLLWVELPRGLDSVKLYEQVRPHQISLAPGALFSNTDRYQHCVRLNLAVRYSERVAQAVQIIGELARQQLQ